MRKFFERTNSIILLITLFCSFLIFLIWNQLIHQLSTDREETISSAIQRNSNLAVTLEQYAVRTIRNADALMQLVKMEYESKGENIDFNTLLNTGVIDRTHFHSVSVINVKGDLVARNFPLDSKMPNLSDREHFFVHKKVQDKLYISKPLQSRTIKKSVIILSRRIDNPDGSFGGTVAVQVEPNTFTQFYSSADLGENDIISLISPDGITYARRTGNKESHGEDISRSPLFHHVSQNPVSHYYARDAIRNIPTYFSYRKLKDYPIIATVGTAEKDVLAGYYTREKRDYIFGSIVTLLLLIFSILISNFLIQRKRIMKRLRISENRYRSIFENSQDAIMVVRPNGSMEAINKAAFSLFRIQYTESETLTFSGLFRESEPVILLQEEKQAPEATCKNEVMFTRKDNSTFTGEIVYSGYQDYEGNTRFVVLIRDISLRKQMEQRLLLEQKRYQRMLTKQIILAQEREREAIGHEMHDNVNQVLTTIKLYLEMAFNNPEMRDQLLPKSIQHIMDCITEIRNLSRELSAPTLGTQSLIDSVKALIEMVSSSAKLVIHLEHENYHTSLIKDQKLAIYRILQEQLNNIIKHAEATEVTIRITQDESITELSVCDNGKGFDIKAKRNGIGLNNISSRAKVFGGEMHIESVVGKGTLLKVVLPVAKAEV